METLCSSKFFKNGWRLLGLGPSTTSCSIPKNNNPNWIFSNHNLQVRCLMKTKFQSWEHIWRPLIYGNGKKQTINKINHWLLEFTKWRKATNSRLSLYGKFCFWESQALLHNQFPKGTYCYPVHSPVVIHSEIKWNFWKLNRWSAFLSLCLWPHLHLSKPSTLNPGIILRFHKSSLFKTYLF